MANKGIFARGYSASRAEKERQDLARENMGKRLWKFFLKDDGEEADLHFLTEEPVNFYEHNLKRADNKFEQFTCIGAGCPDCEGGDRPTYKGAYLVVDRREYEYTDKDGKKKTGRDKLRLFVMGMKVISQLDRISSRYGLSNRDITIVRLGKGTQTTYTIERGDECSFSEREIRNFLPEKLRDEYDGTEDSLMAIVEEQLMMMTRGYNPGEDENSNDDNRSKLISYDDSDDRAYDEAYDDEVEKLKPRAAKKPLFKKPQNSVKPQPRVKNILKKEEVKKPCGETPTKHILKKGGNR